MASRLLSTTTLVTPPAYFNKSPAFLTARVGVRRGRANVKAVSNSSQGAVDGTVYKGVYGPWTIDQADVKEVSSLLSLRFLPNSHLGSSKLNPFDSFRPICSYSHSHVV